MKGTFDVKLEGETIKSELSPYIQDIPSHIISSYVSESLTKQDLEMLKKAKISFMVKGILGNMEPLPPPPPQLLETYKKNDKVDHAIWGRGSIVKILGEGDDLVLSVKFPRMKEPKMIMVRFSPIKKVATRKKRK